MDKKRLLGKMISEIRTSQRSSQERHVERAGISVQYVSNIERGKGNPTLDLLLRLADALKVSLGQMCDFETVEDMNQRKTRSSISAILQKADPDRLRLALKLLRSLF